MVYDWFGMPSTSAEEVRDAINSANGEDLEVEINSPGGDVFVGSEIYGLLKGYNRHVDVKVMSIAASAASVIAMAGGKVYISPTAQIMIHNSFGQTSGDYRDMDKTSEILKNVNETIANAYHIKTGIPMDELLDMMDKETWLTPQIALQKKFVDGILFDDNLQIAASFGNGFLPQAVIEKVLNDMAHEKQVGSQKELDLSITNLNLLKMKGVK